MRLAIVAKFTAAIVFIISASMLLPLLWAVKDGGPDVPALAMSMAIGFTMALVLYLSGKNAKPNDLGTREAFAAVAFAWVFASLQGCLPYLLSGCVHSFADAYFEAMSGFTTTGATILPNVEACPSGILLWRCQTQWLGGMGIVVLTIALLPILGMSVTQLFRAEVPGTDMEKIRPRIQDIALLLWQVYMCVTFAGIVLMLAGGMDLHASLCHIFAAVSTGGFSSWNASVAKYNSAYIDWTLTGIMFFCGANFNLMLLALKTKSLTPYRDCEFRFYFGVIFAATMITTFAIMRNGLYESFAGALRFAAFQVVSIITTTGFVTADYMKWPVFTQILMLSLMLIGGCNASTAGGMKCSRIQTVIKNTLTEFKQLIHPYAVIPVRNGNKIVDAKMVSSIGTFVALYLMIFIVASFLIAATGQDFVTSFGGVAATLGNVGPGLGVVGPVGNFASQHVAAKWIFVFCMLCGRLELYTVLILFSRDTWRR